jgi:hypothetical protein
VSENIVNTDNELNSMVPVPENIHLSTEAVHRACKKSKWPLLGLVGKLYAIFPTVTKLMEKKELLMSKQVVAFRLVTR